MPGGKAINDERYPLRGILLCPKCGNNLTASGSKGRKKHYYYCHCSSACGFRHNSDLVNELFERELSKYEFQLSIRKILNTIILHNFKNVSSTVKDERSAITNRINALDERISKARDMFLSDKIDEDDFRDIKNRYKGELGELKEKLSLIKKSPESEIETKLSLALDAVTNVSDRYRNANLIDKRAIVGSIFPEKLTFDGTSFRTAKMNSFAKSIFLIKKELGREKNGDQNLKNLNPRLVTKTSVSSNAFIDDLIRLSQIKKDLAIPNLEFNFF
ncbi:hypothetical protein M2372_000371 [Chryseobacterium sp. BIGb0232]|nr:hypothetical protein [Chryseobacterium sp. BIGb0232]